MNYFINIHGVKTSVKLDEIKEKAFNYLYGGRGYNPKKFDSRYMQKLYVAFDNEAKRIGGVDYSLGDSLA